ncbi:MAG: VWA domain-containing protein [Anaerolineae bacterium]|nr:VWA domain-containing protein [Anaerolineae bacterium]
MENPETLGPLPARYASNPWRAELDEYTAGGNLVHNIVVFTRLLRHLGLNVSGTQTHDFLHATQVIDPSQRAEFKDAARCLLVTRREDLTLFEQAFDWFWKRRDYSSDARRAAAALAPALLKPPPHARFLPTETAPVEKESMSSKGPVVTIRTFSNQEILRHKDFGAFSRAEVQEAKKLMRNLPWRTGERATRRLARGGDEFFDARATMRRNLRYGGELMEPAWKQTRFKPRPLVVLCDISGSMENYARMLLHFVHALRERETQAECFVFGTRLTRITRQLRTRSVERALRGVADKVVDWSGGTRIGDALKTFNYVWARRVLRPGAVVLIISDGWDRGDPQLLAREMARLKRNVYRIIWLNPLIASAEYEPLTLGLQAALPYVDDFLPAHNFSSLEDLARLLSKLNA